LAAHPPEGAHASSAALIDEIGYLPISRTGATPFFQFMTRRYQRDLDGAHLEQRL
jgi:hypothetical protein